MESIFGGLIEFDDRDDFNNYVETLDREKALIIIEKQIEYFVMNGGFTLLENHVLYKCLLKLKENENKNKGNNLHNDDINGDIN
jgi:hypothetical protein